MRAHRIIFTELRISNNRLAIEKGGFSKIPRNERVCVFCKAGNISKIEDEQHVLLQCSKLTGIRGDFFNSVRRSRPGDSKISFSIG